MLDAAVLVLNRSFLPIHVTSVRRAFILLYQGLAKAVDERYDTFEFDAWRRAGGAQRRHTRSAPSPVASACRESFSSRSSTAFRAGTFASRA